MGAHRQRCNHRWALRPEMLETRELLSALAVHARPAAEVSALAKVAKDAHISGWFAGPGVWTPTAKFRGTNTLAASGESIPLGAITFQASVAYKAAPENGTIVGYNLSNGIGTITDSKGEKLNLHFTGTYYESGTQYGVAWTGSVVGGTGQFSKASGSFKAWGTYDIATGALQIPSITLTLTRK
jgi:hypothetical protein